MRTILNSLFSGCLLACTLWTSAQISQGGTPVSFLFPEVLNQEISTVQMAPVDNEALLAEDAQRAGELEKPMRFGYEHLVELTPYNCGSMTYLPNGDKIWRVGIHSRDALALNLQRRSTVYSRGVHRLQPSGKWYIRNYPGTR
jgi:lysyl endopeptidase